ncbi:thioredoxin domain-containing protein [Tsukamurella sp. 8F]|uniref:thioredoxin domain-containing protein n=1 Tax=unclassified Tsukamurella TaxID=2633480 RepID=UPI0023B9A4C3|nr:MULTISPECIES: thioredoxin domain-containing protein [unclassified Tsukamurella]MDF0530163.1 thioredoxin domain-containing protein [Tsukamurella sp. 8J]MDF0586481.1 thioredoxin domain-containing protein [Tsukamurella sp. 8F]
MTNLLGSATSPYLRQHAENPVHWWQWSEAAFAEARRRDVPVLLSVGYAACHWCHVMAHESFEDPATAEQMNRDFVCVKVDREERPDVDAIYMNATVAMTGQGGWPMTCFLTPDARPFYCGTYYPREPRGGMPSFTQLLAAISDTWRERRDEVDRVGVQVAEHLGAAAGGLPDGAEPTSAQLTAAVGALIADEDPAHAGFGGAPKFPPAAALEALLRHYERTGDRAALGVVERTADAMARGGIYDQLAGGFARYAVDAAWVVPHFEKMLYDNALLLRLYAHLARRTGSELARRVAWETADFLVRDLGAGGAFASSLDADTDGVEGATYVWTPEQLRAVLGDDADWAAEVFEVTGAGTFEHGTSTLQLRGAPDPARFAGVRGRLAAARARRPQPARDDKVVTVWNGLAITALAEAGRTDDATVAAEFVLDSHWDGSILRRSSLGGDVGEAPGMLEDYAAFVTALLAVFQRTGRERFATAARAILDAAIPRFADPQALGGWYDAPVDGEPLLTRPRDPADGATPSGASLIAEALTYAEHLLDPAYAQLASATRARNGILIVKIPRGAGHHLAVAEQAARQLIVAIASGDGTDELVAAARESVPGGAVVVAGPEDSQPLLARRGPVGGRAAAYVCRSTVCSLPVSSPDALADELR